MKTPFTCLLLLLWLVSCQDNQKLTFKSTIETTDTCESCAKIKLTIPEAQGNTKLVRTINTALNEEVIHLLTFDEAVVIETKHDAIASFKNGFIALKQKFSDEIPWEASIEAMVTYEDKDRITLVLDSYIFTGGAHGYGSLTYLNFNKRSGEELEQWQLFEDLEHFQNFAEIKFRIQEGIPQDDAINSTGFIFENDVFQLPNNIGFTKEGLQLLYNPYEIASHADGIITLTLPYIEVRNYLAHKLTL